MFVDYQNFVGSWGRNFVGTSLLPYSAGQFIILLYVCGDKYFMGIKGSPYTPQTTIPIDYILKYPVLHTLEEFES